MAQKILIVEDDPTFGLMLQSWLKKNGFETVLSPKMELAKKEIRKQEFSLILSDLRLPDGDGIMLLAWIKEQKIMLPVIIMTSYAEIQSAVSAIKLGASDFLEKPINPSILKQKIELALNKQPQQQSEKTESENIATPQNIEGKSEISARMYDHIRMVAPTRMSVLILGESGTGKEYAARMIHECSNRKKAPFIAVDCGSLSRELAPSELFGHLKGSFTSAISNKTGVFEQANGGTVFLDEVGNLPYEVQIQLLRALQEQKVRPVGSATDIKVDVRIVAATNEDLVEAIAEGKFREDLYHRLNEFSITVPPLRERVGDISLFANHFLQEANQELDKQVKGINPETLAILGQHHWSGNLRELRNVIRRAALFAQGEYITPDNLPVLATTSGFAPAGNPMTNNAAIHSEVDKDMALRPDNEKEQIEAALIKARGNKTLAAKMLKIDRKTLYNKMHLYQMDI